MPRFARLALSSLLALALLAPAAALAGPGKKNKKPTVEETCAKIVELRVDAYSVTPDDEQREALTGACVAAAPEAEDKKAEKAFFKELACALESSSANTVVDCGDGISAMAGAVKPMTAEIEAACRNQAKLSAAYANTPLTPELEEKLMTGCTRDMGVQDALLSAEDFGKAVRCTAKAGDQAASERCWQ